MSEVAEPAWRAHVGGQLVEIPATIDAVCEVLASDPERLAEFEEQLGSVPALELPAFVAAYALPRQAWDEIDASIERLRAGDFSGCTALEDLDNAGGDTEVPGPGVT
ncbi:hypothetical protein [Streptomyces sp. NPDC051567]|uniref:hypothetical protein n=1 Tax=Streptomyces sp. NPDC051567 TaxID=3365660 RepID=UPI0037AC8A72